MKTNPFTVNMITKTVSGQFVDKWIIRDRSGYEVARCNTARYAWRIADLLNNQANASQTA